MKKLWSIWVYVFRFKRKGFVFHKGFWRTRIYKKDSIYPKTKKSYIKPHWKKSPDQTWRKRKVEEVTIVTE